MTQRGGQPCSFWSLLSCLWIPAPLQASGMTLGGVFTSLGFGFHTCKFRILHHIWLIECIWGFKGAVLSKPLKWCLNAYRKHDLHPLNRWTLPSDSIYVHIQSCGSSLVVSLGLCRPQPSNPLPRKSAPTFPSSARHDHSPEGISFARRDHHSEAPSLSSWAPLRLPSPFVPQFQEE